MSRLQNHNISKRSQMAKYIDCLIFHLDQNLSRSWVNLQDMDESMPTTPISIKFDMFQFDSDSESSDSSNLGFKK